MEFRLGQALFGRINFKDGEIELQTMDEVFNIPVKNCSFVKLDGEGEEV